MKKNFYNFYEECGGHTAKKTDTLYLTLHFPNR